MIRDYARHRILSSQDWRRLIEALVKHEEENSEKSLQGHAS